MNYINYLSNSIIPIVITLILLFAIKEKVNIFDTFLEGSKEGLNIVVGIFPTLIGLFVAVGALRSSGVIDFIVKSINPVISFLKIPTEIMPLALLRPISRKCFNSNRSRYNEKIWSR